MLVSIFLVLKTLDQGPDNAPVRGFSPPHAVAGITVFNGAAYLRLFISTGTVSWSCPLSDRQVIANVRNIASHPGTAVALNHGANHRPPDRGCIGAVITRRQLQSEHGGGSSGSRQSIVIPLSRLLRFTGSRSPAGLMPELIAPLALKE